MNDKFVIGNAYFMLSYLDKDFRYPSITTLVFLGENIEGDEAADLWFFQDAESYLNSGPYTGMAREVEIESDREQGISAQVFDFNEAQLLNLLTMQELKEELG